MFSSFLIGLRRVIDSPRVYVRVLLRSKAFKQGAAVCCAFVPIAYVTSTKILYRWPNAADLINYAATAFAIYWLADEEVS